MHCSPFARPGISPRINMFHYLCSGFCIILAIRITRGTVIKDHGAVRYNMDFVNQVETEEGTIR